METVPEFRLTTSYKPISTCGNAVWIYVLADPRDHVIKYVGKTACRLETRLAFHLKYPTSSAMRAWLSGLSSEGVTPEIVPIEQCGRNNWQPREVAWIRKFGDSILNVELGGDGKFRRENRVVKSDPETVKRSGPVKTFSRDEIAEMNARLCRLPVPPA